jgi:hypothetical protein
MSLFVFTASCDRLDNLSGESNNTTPGTTQNQNEPATPDNVMPPTNNVYYIIGYNIDCGVEIQGETAKANVYLLISEDLTDTLATKNLPDNLFNFPRTIMPYPIHRVGFYLFPQQYRFTYKVTMNYRPMTETEYMDAACFHLMLWCDEYYYIDPTYIFINEISKIQ